MDFYSQRRGAVFSTQTLITEALNRAIDIYGDNAIGYSEILLTHHVADADILAMFVDCCE